ncbi:MAG TPA: hypothetical protein VF708_06515 [Pyrinomonadaceae bacterium]|jgi:hypothetical protein
MNTWKNLAGVLTFFAVFGLSIAVIKFIHTPFGTVVRGSRAAPSSARIFAPQTASGLASYRVQLVSLDFEARKSYTTLTLDRDLNQPVPESVWVRTYFFRPGEARAGWSTEAVEFQHPFRNGNTVTLTAAARCGWCDQALASTNGYYARVQISIPSGKDVLTRDELTDDDLKTAFPVLVQNKQSEQQR